MNYISIFSSILHLSLLIVVYFIVPYVVPSTMTETVNHWVLVSFSAVFLLLTMMSVRNRINMFIIFLVGAVIISGVLWWIPSFVSPANQTLVVHILIVVSTVFMTIVGAVYSLDTDESDVLLQTTDYDVLLGGKRKRK